MKLPVSDNKHFAFNAKYFLYKSVWNTQTKSQQICISCYCLLQEFALSVNYLPILDDNISHIFQWISSSICKQLTWSNLEEGTVLKIFGYKSLESRLKNEHITDKTNTSNHTISFFFLRDLWWLWHGRGSGEPTVKKSLYHVCYLIYSTFNTLTCYLYLYLYDNVYTLGQYR